MTLKLFLGLVFFVLVFLWIGWFSGRSDAQAVIPKSKQLPRIQETTDEDLNFQIVCHGMRYMVEHYCPKSGR